MKEEFEPIFITGVSRTGSKLVMSILTEHTEIDMIHEVHLINPWWLHGDAITTIKQKIGNISSREDIEKFIRLIEQKKIHGNFWYHEAPYMNLKRIESRIYNSDKEIKTIFRILMEEHAEESEKKISGAKYPTHFSKIPLLMNWYPNSKIIHTIRDPRAVYASQIRKNQFKKYDNLINKSIMRTIMFLHISISYWWVTLLHLRLRNNRNYLAIHYEQLVRSPERSIITLCKFLSIKYTNKMLCPPLSESSHIEMKINGFNADLINKWKEKTSPITAFLLMLVNFIPYRVLQK